MKLPKGHDIHNMERSHRHQTKYSNGIVIGDCYQGPSSTHIHETLDLRFYLGSRGGGKPITDVFVCDEWSVFALCRLSVWDSFSVIHRSICHSTDLAEGYHDVLSMRRPFWIIAQGYCSTSTG